MKILLYILSTLPFIFSKLEENLKSAKDFASTALDCVPVVGNIKGLGEAITGKDIITGEKLSKTERVISLLGAIPGGNYLKNSKHLKNGKKFIKASQRAKKAGKKKNAVKFAKAGARAIAKAEKVSKVVKKVGDFCKRFKFFKNAYKQNKKKYRGL